MGMRRELVKGREPSNNIPVRKEHIINVVDGGEGIVIADVLEGYTGRRRVDSDITTSEGGGQGLDFVKEEHIR
jgi:hypothetical protein